MPAPRRFDSQSITCPECGGKRVATVDSRKSSYRDMPAIRRRRLCKCGYRWTTYEMSSEDLQKIENFENLTMAQIKKISILKQFFSDEK
jgi:transcriptional regulator NrdR family protein